MAVGGPGETERVGFRGRPFWTESSTPAEVETESPLMEVDLGLTTETASDLLQQWPILEGKRPVKGGKSKGQREKGVTPAGDVREEAR